MSHREQIRRFLESKNIDPTLMPVLEGWAEDESIRRRRGRCYELAFHAIYDGEYAEDETARLVHGYPKYGTEDDWLHYGHAWVEFKDGVLEFVYDAVEQAITPKADYYKDHGLDETECWFYTRLEAEDKMVETKVYGAWDDAAPEGTVWAD